jgi:hypothetical protein
LDISTRGLLAITARPPTRGEFVELIVGGQMLVGQVKWAGERRFGSVAALVSGDKRSIAHQRCAVCKKTKRLNV